MSSRPTAAPDIETDHARASTADGNQPTAEELRGMSEAIRRLAGEVQQLGRQELPPASYFGEFLQRVLAALAAEGGVVWLVAADDQQLQLTSVAEMNAVTRDVEPESQHGQLLRQLVAAPEHRLVAPRTNGPAGVGVNPTDYLLLLVPLEVGGRIVGIVEIFQRPGRGDATERGYLRFVAQMGEYASRYLRARQLNQLAERQRWSDAVEQFLVAVHGKLNVRRTAFTAVNEIRRLVKCDRVSLVLKRGRSCQAVAVSGLDSLDRRAIQIRHLQRLVSRTLVLGEPVWFEPGEDDLPPQIDACWQRYVDVSHARSCGIIPLVAAHDTVVASADEPASEAARTVLGALVVENIVQAPPESTQRSKAKQLAGHAANAMANAVAHESIFLLPLWRAIGGLGQALFGRHFGKTLLATIALLLAAFALTAHSTHLMLPVRGQLVPAERHTVFARQDGVVVDVLVRHGEPVVRGQVLLRMRNTDLEVEIASLTGNLTATREQIIALERALLDATRLGPEQQNRLAGELLQLKQVAANLEQQLALVRRKESQLIQRAPHAGQVVTWKVHDRLRHRPVQRGQALMSIADPAGGWELELDVPERHIGHLLDAAEREEEPLAVSFILASHSDRTFHGRLVAIDEQAVSRPESGRSIRVRVALDGARLPELRSDTSVAARIDCGKTTLGYAWFHDLIDTFSARARLWFRS